MQFDGWNRDDAQAFAEKWLPAWSGNRPELLASFYSPDSVYSDPGVPEGVRGNDAILSYFTKLLARNPEWLWTHTGSIPMQDGFLNHWHASIPIAGHTTEVDGVCTVQLRDSLIYANHVFFDRSPLVRALSAS
jgi:hypothetical protein